MLPFTTATAILAGQLLGAAFAAGLNLYATVAIIGLAARLGWIESLPPDLLGLAHGLVIGLAALLFLLELIIEKLPFVGAVWTAAHTIIRPLAAALLTALALARQPFEVQLAGAIAAGVIAFAAHGAQSGLRVALASAPQRRTALYAAAAALILDFVAIAIAVAALLHPAAALGVLAAAALVLLLVGPRLWRAATFGARAVLARLVGFFGRRGWKQRSQMPWRIRGAVPVAPPGRGEARGTRVAALGLRGAGAYRNGWLVFDDLGTARFVFRAITGPRSVTLPPITRLELRPGPVTDAIRASSEHGTFTLFLLKDGPSMDRAATALRDHS